MIVLIARRSYCVEALIFYVRNVLLLFGVCPSAASRRRTFHLFSSESIRKYDFWICSRNPFWIRNLTASRIGNLYLVITNSSKKSFFESLLILDRSGTSGHPALRV